MLISKIPATLNVLIRGSVPAGVTTPCGVIATTLSPTWTPSARASSAPSTTLKPPGVSEANDPRAMCRPMSATVSSCAGSTPRISTPRLASPTESIACPSTARQGSLKSPLVFIGALNAPVDSPSIRGQHLDDRLGIQMQRVALVAIERVAILELRIQHDVIRLRVVTDVDAHFDREHAGN